MHPNVVTFELFGLPEKPKCFMLMHFLHSSLESIPVLCVDDALEMVKQLSAGLSFMHELGFSHSDVKAANVCMGGQYAQPAFILVDLDSTSLFGLRAISTRPYVPRDLLPTDGARPFASAALDWWMLGYMLAEKCCPREACLDVAAQAVSFTRSELYDYLRAHLPSSVFGLWNTTAR